MNTSLYILFTVLLLIALRRIGSARVPIWVAMLAGAIAAVFSGQITPRGALHAIDPDVMVFLFGMFIVGEALLKSGILYAVAFRLLSKTRTTDGLVLTTIMVAGLCSAVLMNDTLAIIGAPLMLRLAQEHGVSRRLMLLALAYAITIGSVMSPIGNPQNLLIAVHGPVDAPFVTFLQALTVPTLINLALAYGLLRMFFRPEFHCTPLAHTAMGITDPALARWTIMGVAGVVIGIGVKITLIDTPLSMIALFGAAPIVLFSARRWQIVRAIDWTTLVFFAAMFILMASVWQSGALQTLATHYAAHVSDVPTVLGISLVLSQLISNVPLVALYLPMLTEAGTSTPLLMALAAGSTIAGNLLILGAASNVIIIQHAEQHGATLSFWDFARVGVPLGLINALVYWGYLSWWYGTGG